MSLFPFSGETGTNCSPAGIGASWAFIPWRTPNLLMDVLGVDGVVVEDVVVNSPADTAGIQPGDVITHMDSRSLRSVRDMLRELGRHRPGETVPLVVVRKGTAYKADLTFGRRGDLMSGLKYQEQTQG